MILPDRREIVYALYGAWRLLLLDASGMRFFNITVEGFWRSFVAIALVMPVYAANSLASYGTVETDLSPGGWVAFRSLQVVISWTVYVLTMSVVTRVLGRFDNYAGLIIAMNWMAVPQSVIFMTSAILSLIVPRDVAAFIEFVVLCVMLFYDAYVARVALEINLAQAIGVAIIGLLIMLLVLGLMIGPA